MDSESEALKRAEVVDEVSKWGVGLGIVIVALFPLSIPFLLLTAVALLPLLIPLVALGLVVAVAALPIALARRLLRQRRRPAHEGPPREVSAGEPAQVL
jgi:Flp pilus assembly protein TadB